MNKTRMALRHRRFEQFLLVREAAGIRSCMTMRYFDAGMQRFSDNWK